MKTKKCSYPVSIRMNRELFDRLSTFCDESGQSKTKAIERALSNYIDEYEKVMARARLIERKSDNSNAREE